MNFTTYSTLGWVELLHYQISYPRARMDMLPPSME